MTEWVLGVIGGSGLYEIPGISGSWRSIESPWGEASDAVFDGRIDGVRVVFLPRHGRGHRVGPSDINYRANIDVLKRAGCTDVIALSACGSLREDRPPGAFVVLDQFIDRTFARAKTYFGRGLVGHVSMARPVCERLSALIVESAEAVGGPTFSGGVYLAMEGPQFSTFAESELYRRWKCDVIGMTGMPEAKLAREAELPYANVAMVTDYDCWHADHDDVVVTDIVKVMHANSERAKALIRRFATLIAARERTPSPIDDALEHAIITPPDFRDPAVVSMQPALAARARRGKV